MLATRRRKIAVVTTTRADYGILSNLLREIRDDDALILNLIVGGTHLAPEFGATYRLIEQDGFKIDALVEYPVNDDMATGAAISAGMATIKFAAAYDLLKPDLVVLLGDRFEILSAAQAATLAKLPIAHIHGGEITRGAIDDAIRHALTKLAHLHFPAAEPYRQRIIQLGEEPQRIFNFGAPGIDVIRKTVLLTRQEFEKMCGFRLGPLSFLITYHPVTLGNGNDSLAFQEILNALDQFPDAGVIITKPNADTNRLQISNLIDKYALRRPGRTLVVESLGHTRYLSAISHVDVVIGNSSSGIIEVPFFGKPTVNIGSRQDGRLKADSIIDCEDRTEKIVEAIRLATSEVFREQAVNTRTFYGEGKASSAIKDVLKNYPLDGILTKHFINLSGGEVNFDQN